MRKQIRIRGVVAFLLALSLVFMGSVSAFADDPETVDLGDIPYLEVTSGEFIDAFHYDDFGGQEGDLPNGSTINAGNVEAGIAFGETEYDFWSGFVCTDDFTGQATVNAGDVGSAEEPCSDPAVWINASGENTEVKVEAGNLYSESIGLLVDNADASVEVSTQNITTISGEEISSPYGVFLGDTVDADFFAGMFSDGDERDAYTGDATTTVHVEGDINVYGNENNFFATGIGAGGTAATPMKNGRIILDATGSLNVISACENSFSQGITVYTAAEEKEDNEEKSSVDISVGSINAKADAASYGSIIANQGAGSASVTVNDGVSSVATDLAIGISALSTGDAANTSVTVEAGGITVSGNNNELPPPEDMSYTTTGILTQNERGTISISSAGDILSTGFGMMLFDSASEEPGDDDWGDWDDLDDWDDGDGDDDGDIVGEPSGSQGVQGESAGKSTTLVEVVGNVTADECGVYFDLQKDNSSVDVLIDGTLSGENTSVLLSNETVIDNLTLTVWEVKANSDGNLAERIDNWGEEDDPEMATVADKELEKKIQYIIKIDPAWENKIGTSGTKSYHMTEEGTEYQVANQGDRITLLKLDIPAGKQIAAAYWDKDRSESSKLLQDSATGDYYLTVPKGGGVWLSIVLEDIPDDPKPDPRPDPNKKATAQPILILRDVENKIELRFFGGGRFEAVMESGNPDESGSFIKQEDRLVLVDGNNQQIPVGEDGTFTYISVENPSLSYQFEMTGEQYALLLANAKK